MNTHWNRLLTLAAVAVSAAAIGEDHNFTLNDGMYTNPLMANEGVSISFTTQTDGSQYAFAAWYTYDKAGYQLYLAGGGEVELLSTDGGVTEFALMEMYTTQGGVHGPEPVPTSANLEFFGEVAIYAQDCNTIALETGPGESIIMLDRFPAAHDCSHMLMAEEEVLDLVEAARGRSGNACSSLKTVWDIRTGFVDELTLDDGVVWRVRQEDHAQVYDWNVGDKVMVCPTSTAEEAVMTSFNAYEAVGARRVRVIDDLPPQ